jgi:hypothetical protein
VGLTRREADLWQPIVCRHLGHYARALDRMKRRVGPEDRTYRLIAAVEAALHDLHVDLHYTSVGKPPFAVAPPPRADQAPSRSNAAGIPMVASRPHEIE